MRPPDAARWIFNPKPDSRASVRLFCIPFAGGSAQAFLTWPQDLPGVDLCAINLPGRGRRFAEPSADDLLALARGVAGAMRPLVEKPFALFGHSMGALVAFEVSRMLRDEYGISPVHLLASGAAAPQYPDTHGFHKLSDAAFMSKVSDLNGINPEVLGNRELMDLLLPALRGDFKLTETYNFTEGRPLDCPISVFGGADDPLVSREKLAGWRVHTTGRCFVDILPGDHFFIQSAKRELLEMIARRLAGDRRSDD